MKTILNSSSLFLRLSAAGLAGLVWSGAALAEMQPWVPEVHGEYSLLGALHRTGGAGDKTLLDRGEFLTQELKLDIDTLLNDDWHFDTDLHLRHTKDHQIDTRDSVHLLGWTSELYNREWHFTGGDFYGDFTQYTLAQALKGAQIQFKNETVEAKLVAGYSQRQTDTTFFRYVMGGRVETLIARQWGMVQDLRVGANFSAAEDDHGSSHGFPTGVPDVSNRVGSMNFSATLAKSTELNGEIAQAWIDADQTVDTNVERKFGTAMRLNSLTRFSKMTKMRLGYEWVQANFGTVTGSAVPDRVTFNGRLDHKLSTTWSSEASYRVSYDKLDNSTLNKRTLTQTPHLALNWMPEAESWYFKDYTMRLFWDQRDRHSGDDPSGQIAFISNDYGIENEFKVQRVNFTSGWTLRTETDDFNKDNDALTNSAYLGMRMRETIGTTKVMPSIRYQFDNVELFKTDSADFTQSLALGLTLEPSDRIKWDQRLTFGLAKREVDDSDSLKVNFYTGLEYRLPTPQDLTLRVTYEHLNFIHGKTTQSFSEHNLQTELVWRF